MSVSVCLSVCAYLYLCVHMYIDVCVYVWLFIQVDKRFFWNYQMLKELTGTEDKVIIYHHVLSPWQGNLILQHYHIWQCAIGSSSYCKALV